MQAIDYGWWRAPDRTTSRLSWDIETGMLYFFHAGSKNTEFLAHVPTRQDTEDLLHGWEEQINRHTGMTWVRLQISRGVAGGKK